LLLVIINIYISRMLSSDPNSQNRSMVAQCIWRVRVNTPDSTLRRL